MKRNVLAVCFSVLIVAFLTVSVNASVLPTSTLQVTVECFPQTIMPNQAVTITCTANMEGMGIIFVMQPSQGSSVSSLPLSSVQEDLSKISSDPDFSMHKVISYAWVNIASSSGGEQKFTFPQDFTGLNGKPSTQTMGKYYAFFIFLHMCIYKWGFDCASFFVVPEVPFGTLVATIASFGALMGYAAVKRSRIKRHLSF